MAGSIEQYSASIAIVCIIGSALSAYSFYLVSTLEEDDEYEALCDITENVSCTKVFQSEYARGFGLIAPLLGSDSFFNKPNGLYGLLFYIIVSLLGLSKHWLAVKVQVVLAIATIFLSVWLAYVLYFILQNFCIICGLLYIINIVIVNLAIIRHQRLQQQKSSSSSGTSQKKKAPAKKGRSKKE